MKLSQIIIDSIYSLRNDGRTHAQIAQILGICEKTVWIYLKKKRIQDAIMKSTLGKYKDTVKFKSVDEINEVILNSDLPRYVDEYKGQVSRTYTLPSAPIGTQISIRTDGTVEYSPGWNTEIIGDTAIMTKVADNNVDEFKKKNIERALRQSTEDQQEVFKLTDQDKMILRVLFWCSVALVAFAIWKYLSL